MKENVGEEDFIDFPAISRQANYYKGSVKGEIDMCDIVQEYADMCAEKAVAEERAKTIQKFLKSGMSASNIANVLELPLAEVEKYAAELSTR